MARERLGNHHRKSPQRWMEMRLYDATTDGKGRLIWVVAAELATFDALLCMQIKSCLPFSNSNPQSVPGPDFLRYYHDHRLMVWQPYGTRF